MDNQISETLPRDENTDTAQPSTSHPATKEPICNARSLTSQERTEIFGGVAISTEAKNAEQLRAEEFECRKFGINPDLDEDAKTDALEEARRREEARSKNTMRVMALENMQLAALPAVGDADFKAREDAKRRAAVDALVEDSRDKRFPWNQAEMSEQDGDGLRRNMEEGSLGDHRKQGNEQVSSLLEISGNMRQPGPDFEQLLGAQKNHGPSLDETFASFANGSSNAGFKGDYLDNCEKEPDGTDPV